MTWASGWCKLSIVSERFEVVTTNPNDSTGGGGCLCSEVENPDTEGPFVVFPHQEMASNLSPHSVVCARCVIAAAEEIEQEDPLAGGEVIPGIVEEPQVVNHDYTGIPVDPEDDSIPEV